MTSLPEPHSNGSAHPGAQPSAGLPAHRSELPSETLPKAGFTALVAEDEPQMASIIAFALGTEGFVVTRVGNGVEAVEAALHQHFDVLVLDVMMPRLDGLEVCRRLRAEPFTADIAILLVTARVGSDEAISGFEAGADDYLAKPFHPRELALRAAALARRTRGVRHVSAGESLDAPPVAHRSARIAVDLARFEATLDGTPLRLTTNEMHLLATLVAHRGEALRWERLLSEAWGVESWEGGREMVKAAVYRLRQKLDDDPNGPEFIVAVRGVGYRFVDR
jgi:DNA-binding response OmpR family regulator